MVIRNEALEKRLKVLETRIEELTLKMSQQTNLVLQLLDEKRGLEAVFQEKINKMVDDNLEIVMEFDRDSIILKEHLENEVKNK